MNTFFAINFHETNFVFSERFYSHDCNDGSVISVIQILKDLLNTEDADGWAKPGGLLEALNKGVGLVKWFSHIEGSTRKKAALLTYFWWHIWELIDSNYS